MDLRLWLGYDAWESISPSLFQEREAFVCIDKLLFEPRKGIKMDLIGFSYAIDPSSGEFDYKGFDMEYKLYSGVWPNCDFGSADQATFHPCLGESTPLNCIPDRGVISLLGRLMKSNQEDEISDLLRALWLRRDYMKDTLNRGMTFYTARNISVTGNYLRVSLVDKVDMTPLSNPVVSLLQR